MPSELTSGIRKLVRTPADVGLGDGLPREAAGQDRRRRSWCRRRRRRRSRRARTGNAAPRIELVGPEANVATGYRRAYATSISVPSFWLRNSGAVMPARFSAAASRVDDVTGEIAQGGVDDRGVLPRQQADPADLVGQGDVHVRPARSPGSRRRAARTRR